jgi:hypothetical protein
MRLIRKKRLRRVLKGMAKFTPLKLALWCLILFVLRDLARSFVEFVGALKSMGYGAEFFILLFKDLSIL